MTTKLGNVVTYHAELPLRVLLNLSNMWFFEVTWHIRYFISWLAIDRWSPIMVRCWLIYVQKRSIDRLKTLPRQTSLPKCLSLQDLPGSLRGHLNLWVTYHKDLPLIISNDPSRRFSCKVTWKIKYLMSPLAEEHVPHSREVTILPSRDWHPYMIILKIHISFIKKLVANKLLAMFET